MCLYGLKIVLVETGRYLFVLIKQDRERYIFAGGNGLCIMILPLCIYATTLAIGTQQVTTAGPKVAHGPRW